MCAYDEFRRDREFGEEKLVKPIPGKVNAVRCLYCGDIIQSRSRHDFVYCSCKNTFVDGGLDYQRVGGKDLNMIEFLRPVVKSEEGK